jgi:hypothetical protein
MRRNKNFERELPPGYKLAFHINAKDKGTAILLSLGSLAITAVVFILLLIPLFKSGIDLSRVSPLGFFRFYLNFLFYTVLYIVLHELTHGLVYKIMTGEKLTFGITSAAAFCGVPKIYTYRRCALAAILAPLVVFTIIIGAIVLFLSFASPLYYVGFSFIFALHLGGCIGDGYLGYLLLTRFKSDSVLMKDTGPEQFIYEKKK